MWIDLLFPYETENGRDWTKKTMHSMRFWLQVLALPVDLKDYRDPYCHQKYSTVPNLIAFYANS